MAFQGQYSDSVDQEIMEIQALQIKDTLLRLNDKGFNLKWKNNEIISWFLAEGKKLTSKAKYKKIPTAIIYLLRKNDLETIAENERAITSIKEIEKARSEELQKLRAQVEAFTFERQGWARQSEMMSRKIEELQNKLQNGNNYISALEDCCNNAGFPVAAVKQAALDETLDYDRNSDSDDDDVAALDSQRNRDPVQRHREQNQRSPIKTRAKSSEKPSKSVKIAVLKTITNTNDEITTISRPLTCEECTTHKQIVGMMPRRGPFQPYWETLMLQATVYKLETRDVWQIALLTIPEELRSKLTPQMKSGDIIKRNNNETDESIFERLKQALLDIRGPTSADWSRILQIKQESNEPFETFAERLWTTYKEYSGLENASRDHEPLLQLIKNNAGTPVQNALLNGADSAENTFRAIVDWGSRIENRWKSKPHSIASAHWMTEGNYSKSSGTEKHVHFLEEVTCCDESRTFSSEEACATAQDSVPISVLKEMQHHNSAESWTRAQGVKKALEIHENPQTSGEHSKQTCGKDSRFCSSCQKIGHTEEKCWSLGRGRPPPYFLKS
ncbi:uncharacterized protein LOC127984361 [Carassius gibelio]|uniref:uncharacterized protein LOC127984361 n=1 Tax=Carassius gibelio TaxID=101364 RepID=UPI0022791F4B|nr:uncharacterized protein LOC127984361 [Carassius gibelio]